MRQQYFTIIWLAGVVLLQACGRNDRLQESRLDSKCEPNDQFAFQRSYPDKDFDWKGWKTAMSDIRFAEKALAKSPDCGAVVANWTEQGPANVGARCNTLAVKPDDENTVLAGFAGGGIFKSGNGGVNWHPVFDDHLELCIGDITFDPNNPSVVYAGTGDPNLPSIVFNGDGVYKSTDAGETWTYLGLSEQGIVSKVLVHPTNPKILYVAAMGNPYVRDNQRGVYRSIDGGNNWQQVLFVSNQAGASDLVQSPTNPNILYASFWDRIRSNSESIVYGPNAKVYKSADGGETWTKMEGGLPSGTNGRTGLAISQQNPDKVYALYVDSLSTTGGLYKTTNGGTSWTPVNVSALEDACSDFGWYFGKIRMNPTNDEDLYFLAILLYRKPSGSNTWISAGGGHADCHDLIFTPSGRRYWANDGGVYRNDPGQMTWTKCKNLPVTQFYHTTFNPHQPNVYWGGSQDNGVQKGAGGPNINNWTSVFSADGFRCAFDPNDPQTFWVEIQNGTIHKTTDGGSTWQFGSANLGTSDRCSWDAPFFMSQYGDIKLYSATYRAYVSTGNGWASISPDLTDGIIYTPRFHTVTTMAESPVQAEKLMAGTSDGNVWRREPAGNWMNLTGNLPDRFVTSVQLSPTLSQRLYVTHSGFRNDEYIPHVHRSDNNGATWTDISSDLPQMPVNDLLVLPNHADSVLIVATDAGVYLSKNSGAKWVRLGGNMPVIPVFDVELNPVRKELVAGTFARGIWTIPIDSILAQQPAVVLQLSGNITTEAGAGVSQVHVGNAVSEASGNFQLTAPGCAPFMVTPVRNDNLLNGLTTYDLVLISKHILGIEALGSPFRMIAADANRSNSITTFDIVALRKLILGIDTVLIGNTSWRFVPKSHVFSNPNNPFVGIIPQEIEAQLQGSPMAGLNFTAVKVGDVNNSVQPNAVGPVSDRTVGQYPLRVQDLSFKAQETLEVPFGSSAEALAALQFTIQFDTTRLQFIAVESMMQDISADNFGINRIQQGLLSISLGDQQGIRAETGLFKVIFRVKRSGQLQQALKLGSFPTPALAFRTDGSALLPGLWGGSSSNITVTPNPFGKAGTVLTLETTGAEGETGGHLLEIFDLNGKVLLARTASSGQQVFIESSVFPQAGVYFWRLRSSGRSGKLVFTP